MWKIKKKGGTYDEIESGTVRGGGGPAGRQHDGSGQKRLLARVVAVARPLGPVTAHAAPAPALALVGARGTVRRPVAPARQHLFELLPEVLVQPGVQERVVARGAHGHRVRREEEQIVMRPHGRLQVEVVQQVDRGQR